jgi:hypothetical protein
MVYSGFAVEHVTRSRVVHGCSGVFTGGGVQGYWTLPRTSQKNKLKFLHVCEICYVKHSQGS